MHGNGVDCRLRHGKMGTRAMNTVNNTSTCGKLASPAWELYGKKGLVGDKWPNPEKPQQEGCVSYHLRTGKHFLTPYDWDRYMDFADRHGWRWAKPY